ncbi:MAG TPA: MauE/DoxX family redox-associated membrane protein [Trebonia sp.]|jgi:hypothetical protein|nr:MauE/DoxX family redox-associated membrane protein [Trebonia sp.]
MPLGGAVLGAAREVQVPILALLLLGACAAKAQRAIRTRSIDTAISPAAMFPLRLRNSTAVGLCASELGLGIGLLVTAGDPGTAAAAVTVRVATALLFAIAVAALNEMRISRPDAGCGCFGDLSDAPVTMRSLARSAVLGLAALGSVGTPPLRVPASPGQGALLVLAAACELLLVAAISPETSEILVRLGYREPCEARRLPVARTLASLRASRAWRHYRPYLTAQAPGDVWREGCWRFVTYPASVDGRDADVVFSVYLQSRRPAVLAAVVAAASGLGPQSLPVETLRVERLPAPWPAGRARAAATAASPAPWPAGRARAAATAASPASAGVRVPSRPAVPAPLAAVVVPAPRPVPTFTPAPLAVTAPERAAPTVAAPGLPSPPVPVHPLAHVAPRVSALAPAGPDPAVLRRPRFVPSRPPARHAPSRRRLPNI